ncbi:tyrosine-type recombinase/integrase [Veillonella parvula]|nr:tyrosine-type recombinase/integrase [Veillonella parvula]MDU3190484.1 tyrosine-type recombinase/integrase [Veillonella parvula]
MYSWEQCKLSDLTQLITKGTTPKVKNIQNGVNFIKVENISDDGVISINSYVSEEEHMNFLSRSILSNNDILFSIAGTLGRTAIVKSHLLPANTNQALAIIRLNKSVDVVYINTFLKSNAIKTYIRKNPTVGAQPNLSLGQVYYPSSARAISMWEQRKWWGGIMLTIEEKSELFYIYYEKWIRIYKEGAIRNVTMRKYEITLLWLKKLVPELRLSQLNRISYQQLLNDYAEFHERQTTMDFHHQIKAAILDAVDEGFIDRDPTRKAIIKGRSPRIKKIKYLNQFELHTLLVNLKLTSEINWDWLILIIAKTGMRFSEALALTPKDFDFSHQSLIVDKTWDYKGNGGFLPTKNRSSVRKIQLDWQTIIKFSELIKGLPEDKPIFVKGRVFNSTINGVLERYCKKLGIPVISIHGLRHTHASLLLFAGVSIASVARRLGHASMTTTQKTYIHIIQEMENRDIDLVMRSMAGLA